MSLAKLSVRHYDRWPRHGFQACHLVSVPRSSKLQLIANSGSSHALIWPPRYRSSIISAFKLAVSTLNLSIRWVDHYQNTASILELVVQFCTDFSPENSHNSTGTPKSHKSNIEVGLRDRQQYLLSTDNTTRQSLSKPVVNTATSGITIRMGWGEQRHRRRFRPECRGRSRSRDSRRPESRAIIALAVENREDKATNPGIVIYRKIEAKGRIIARLEQSPLRCRDSPVGEWGQKMRLFTYRRRTKISWRSSSFQLEMKSLNSSPHLLVPKSLQLFSSHLGSSISLSL